MSSSPDTPTAHGVRIDAQPGTVDIAIDGQTLPRGQVTGYVLQHDVHAALPQLILHTRQPEGVLFEGFATVAVAAPEQDYGDVIAQFLAGIDPAALQRAALDRDDLDGSRHETTTAILAQLANWAKGKGS